jgi:hypothetical protein
MNVKVEYGRWLFAAVFVVCAGTGILALGEISKNRFSQVTAERFFDGDRLSYVRAKAYWSTRIEKKGGIGAYQELLNMGRNFSYGNAHTVAHVFGEALYAQEGVEAIGVCDERLFYGCWHQFVEQSLAQEGLPILPKLTKLCSASSNPSGCVHGIGHGILAHVGYGVEGVKEALTLCAQVEPRNPRNGCSEGVFMEYNLQELSAAEELAAPRKLSKENRYEPCLFVDPSYASACGFELPVWWGAAQATTLSQNSLMRWMGEACTEAPLEGLRTGCMQGVGFMMALSDGSERTAQLCAIAAKTERDKLLCLSGAASALPVRSRSELASSCQAVGLSGEARQYCVKYGQAEEVYKDAVPLPF